MKNSLNSFPRLVITMGEAAGIGPELIVRIAQSSFPAQLVVLADGDHLKDIATKIDLPLKLSSIDWQEETQIHRPGHLWIENIFCEDKVEPGTLNTENAKTTLRILDRAADLAMSDVVDAIVTSPVHKANLNQIDPSFLGHTEFFANRAGVDRVVMMLATLNLRMTLATTHLPLSQVPSAITKQSLRQTIEIILDSLNRLTKEQVKLAICGLNPHAGEDGLLGLEEIEVITPLIQQLQKEGYALEGPFPADTLFTPQKQSQYDVFLAMYHDQGLPVIKASGFGQCANVTLGLPYIRTSVDHGTALDIASSFKASGESLEFAINYAIALFEGKLP